MSDRKQIMTKTAMKRVIARVAHEIAERNLEPGNVVIVGIQKGGVHFAERLCAELERIWGQAPPMGVIDVTMYRDDHGQRVGMSMQPTQVPVDVAERIVVLVDDVVSSGRTTRAALDALKDLGRPRAVQLAVLVDRGGRELPITADFVGIEEKTSAEKRIDVEWAEAGGADGVFRREL
jgi:pyrimidine operon attenuation protein/uracil phosphoribosyltransferase